MCTNVHKHVSGDYFIKYWYLTNDQLNKETLHHSHLFSLFVLDAIHSCVLFKWLCVHFCFSVSTFFLFCGSEEVTMATTPQGGDEEQRKPGPSERLRSDSRLNRHNSAQCRSCYTVLMVKRNIERGNPSFICQYLYFSSQLKNYFVFFICLLPLICF